LADQTAAQTLTRGLGAPGQLATAESAMTSGLGGATSAMGGIDVARGFTPGTITDDDVLIDNISDTFVDETITTDRFTDPGTAENYMNPYQQQVVDVQTQEARRQADIAKASRGLGSINRGTFGGGRQALMEG